MEEDYKIQLESKDSLIKSLQDNIATMKDSLNLKNEQIKTLESSLKIKDEKIETIEKSIKVIEEQIQSASSSSGEEKAVIQKELEIALAEKEEIRKEIANVKEYNEKLQKRLEETVEERDVLKKNKEIAETDNENLQKELDILNEELGKADKDLEQLELENEKLREASSKFLDSKIIDSTELEISKTEILEKMRKILQNAKHNIMIAVPSIEDLQELFLYEVRSSVSMKISCSINPGVVEHADLTEEFESLDNITLRNYSGEDRFTINRDSEELLFAVVGKSESNHLVIHTRDASHITLYNSLVMDSWLRARKLER